MIFGLILGLGTILSINSTFFMLETHNKKSDQLLKQFKKFKKKTF